MTVADDARQFIVSRVLEPAQASATLDAKSKQVTAHSMSWLQHFRRVGDLVTYMQRFRGGGPETAVYRGLRDAGLPTFEDIRDEFLERFGAWSADCTRLDDFVVGNEYSPQDVLIFAGVYDTRAGGMFPIGKVPNHRAVFIKATLSGGRYANEWLTEPDRLKYYLKSRTIPKTKTALFKETYIENRAIIEYPSIPVFAFVRNEPTGPFILRGVFRNEAVHREADGSKWFELVRLDSTVDTPSVRQRELIDQLDRGVTRSQASSRESRLARLAAASKRPQRVAVIAEGYVRNPDVVAEVLFRAGGVCEVCRRTAPFNRSSDGSPYLEVHHIVQLADGGDDTVENAVAACPNCHRREHYGDGQIQSR